jgi:acyl-[acyl carrier protein]--UDP-N-acetylglucosamine O-acyltransferase
MNYLNMLDELVCNHSGSNMATYGRGVIVAVVSVVTKDVAPFSIIAGNPAK